MQEKIENSKEKIKLRRKENSQAWRKRIKDAGYVVIQVVTRPHLKEVIKKYVDNLNAYNNHN